MIGIGSAQSSQRFAGGLTQTQFLGIVCLFWVYVTISNLLYGYSMSNGIARVTNVMVFATWDTRLLQHVLLLPMLLVSFWASLKVQWRPILIALPLQLILGAVFSAMAYPVMILSEVIMATDQSHGTALSQVVSAWSDPFWVTLWLASFVSFLPAYGFGLALVTGLALYTRFRDSEVRLAALEREWSAARLAALRMQLSPHTLFNLLHTIRGHIEWDPKAAQSMVVQLADLLRRLLNAGERDFSRLADELHFANLYLELQQRRFTDRLIVVLPNPVEVPAVWVPSLILQPLIENAVVHGLSGHQGIVTVSVSVTMANDTVLLRVTNTVCVDRGEGADGIGLKNVRERMAVQFEGRASLIAGAQGGEWISEIRMPAIRESPPVMREVAVGSKLHTTTFVGT
ncbi:MAG TPA: histidine kinase, partial [Steroidobacteraceae bacterium]|nr:histidine kinase [Steroidobacteraceae bacterium]